MATLTIRRMADADIAAADEIAGLAFAGTDSRADDLRRYLDLEPEGWLIALDGDAPVGLVGALRYGPFAWVGNMAVRPTAQGRGVGRALMTALLAWLDERGTPTVLLDATPAGAPLYLALGFVDVDRAYVCTRPAGTPALERTADPLPSGVVALTAADTLALARVDAPIFGADRSALLRRWLEDHPGRAFGVVDGRGELAGYAIAQSRRIGPWVARDAAGGERLLRAALSLAFTGSPLVVGTGANTDAARVLTAHGFAEVSQTRHMRRGPLPPRDRARIWGQSSYAVG